MKHRRVFSVGTISAAHDVIHAARAAGVDDDDIFLIARQDIEMESIPPDRIDASMDTLPAAVRGAVGGGSAGLLAGLVAIAFPAIGITVAGIGALTAVGALVGTWSTAMFGSGIANNVRRQYEEEIEAGRILVVLEVAPKDEQRAHAAVVAAGATALAHAPHEPVS